MNLDQNACIIKKIPTILWRLSPLGHGSGDILGFADYFMARLALCLYSLAAPMHRIARALLTYAIDKVVNTAMSRVLCTAVLDDGVGRGV